MSYSRSLTWFSVPLHLTPSFEYIGYDSQRESVMSLQLPPEIKMRKEPFGSSWKYVFRHDKLGDLGQIVVQGQPNGETKFTTEIAGGESDPMFNQLVDLFLPLSKKVMEFVQAQLGKNSRDAKAKPTGANSKHIIPSKIMTCSTCNQPGLVLLSDNSTAGT